MSAAAPVLANPEAVFVARGLSKVYRLGDVEVHALRGVDLELYRGEFVVILGPSGSGKSTLLNILGGLDAPTSGQVRFLDHELTGAGERELTRFRREHVGFVFQFYNLIPSLATELERQIESFMPAFDVRSCHEIIVHAPATVVFDTAEHLDLLSIPLVRAIFWLRGKIMGAAPSPPRRASGLVAETKRLGWGELARRPGSELVMGAAAQPWNADVTFTTIPPDAFLAYAEPNRVKIAWTLEAVPIEPRLTLVRTETRVRATDAAARAKLLRYWRFTKIGVLMIRWLHLPAVRKAAERNSSGGRP